MFKFSQKSLEKLNGVHPDLVRVIKRALELSPVDFSITQGVRTQAEQNALYEQGRTKPGPIVTWTKKSKHIEGLAVDVVPHPVDWDDLNKFKQIANAVKLAACELGVNIIWGGDWIKNKDYPHFELADKK